ncbi:MAG: hypothetical protein GX458_21390 [Phyllobacteriaceae bacterium]|nr:hypothetical protein [Phyllobacteriaceae bacterium]
MLEYPDVQFHLTLAVKVNASPLRFVWLIEPEARTCVVTRDVLAAARYPKSVRREMSDTVAREFSSEHLTIDMCGRKTSLVSLSAGLALFMRAAEEGNCSDYLADVFQVVADHAQDRLFCAASAIWEELGQTRYPEGGE